MASYLAAMASNLLLAMASYLVAMASNLLLAMAFYLVAMASNLLLAMASYIVAMASNLYVQILSLYIYTFDRTPYAYTHKAPAHTKSIDSPNSSASLPLKIRKKGKTAVPLFTQGFSVCGRFELCSVGTGITEKVIKSDLSGWTSPELSWESGNLRGPTWCLTLRAVAGLLVVGNEWFLGSPRPFREMNGFLGLHVPPLACLLASVRLVWLGLLPRSREFDNLELVTILPCNAPIVC